VLAHLGVCDQALADFSRAIQLAPQLAAPYRGRAGCRRLKQDHAGALADYAEAIRLAPDVAETYLERAACHAERADYDLALADCTTALRLAPDNTSARRYRADLYNLTNDFAWAVEDYRAVLRRAPDDEAARLQLVLLWAACPDRKVRDLGRAERHAARLDPQAPPRHRALATLAAAHARAGDLERAIAWQQKALACSGHLDKEDQRRARLVLQMYQGRKKEADKTSSHATAPPPEGGPARR
jgi:tetratricopeptide (TPR) repeat protein